MSFFFGNNSGNGNANTNTNTNANANPNTSSFTFGGGNSNNNNNSSFLGGNNSNSSFNFGNNNSNNNNTASNNAPNFAFGNQANNNNNNNNGNSNNNPNNAAQMTGGGGDNPLHQIKQIADQYDASHGMCRFETILYNKLPANIPSSSFDKPPMIRTQIWDQGIKNNPSPTELIPVGIRGYQQLNERSNLCLAGHCSAIKRFQEISEKLNALKNEININTKQSIVDLKQMQIHLSLRLLSILRVYVCQVTQSSPQNAVASSSSSLHPSSSSSMAIAMNLSQSTPTTTTAPTMPLLCPSELKLKHVLQQMMRESKQLASLYQHVQKLSLQLGMDDGSMYRRNGGGGSGGMGMQMQSMDHIDASSMKQMFEFLQQQQKFVSLLTKTVQNDVKDLNVIGNGIEPQNVQYSQQSMLFNAASTSSSALFAWLWV